MKPATACDRCRYHKRKCWKDKAGEGCLQCRRNRAACSLLQPPPAPSFSDTSSTPEDSESQSTPGQGLLVSNDVAELLVDEYIRCILDRPHSIFHLPTLRTAVRERSLSPALRCALLSYGARFHSDPKLSSLSAGLFEEGKRHLHLDQENVCLENVQTCILLANLSAASLRPSSEALYLSIAIHMAEVLQLSIRRYTDPPELQELKRRIWWSLFMADYWCSTGNGLRRKMTDCDRALDLPMDEYSFHKSGAPSPPRYGVREPGLWAHMITLVQIFGQIHDLNLRVVQDTINKQLFDDQVIALGGVLTAWETSLPEHVQYSLANLYSFRAKGLGGPFVALHQGFYHYSILLYYQYLDINRVTTPQTRDFPRLCKRYAIEHSNLLHTAKEIGDCEVLYPGVGHSAVISSSVLLHTVLFGEEHEVERAQDSLQSNFEVLEDLSRYWPSLELTIRRLTVFQKSCTEGAAMDAYTFDEWMLTFLLKYHLPLDDKASDYAGNTLPVHEKQQAPQTGPGLFAV